jgi:eukaryotic-like serine/threonine-protein kinase
MNEETLFHEALARPAAERAAFLDAACAGQTELRAAVEALLAGHGASANVLDRPAAHGQPLDPDRGPLRSVATETSPPREGPAPLPQPPSLAGEAGYRGATLDYGPDAQPGSVIAGRYTLVQLIGEGGMGEVWIAKQTEPVKRKVALKLIKAGMDSRAVLQRFEQERQALALMEHPHIAKVLDGGLTAGRRPFFVMELVNGLPLTRFCDEAKLGVRERLELFVPICQAVQHAHQKGIIHRDLKPSNILVTIIDGRNVPKVIDFGVAKATSGRLTEESLSTQFGAVIGTLEYMAPEQAGIAGEDIDTRADIYSLGVILYELLTGLQPLDTKRLRKAALTELVRMIKEEEPSKPSTRVSTGGSAPSLAAVRHTEPRKLAALLRGELDWVVMKCLEKQRDRRYETANGLARDIQRYLCDEVVEARPPSAGYRLRKFVSRNKGRVAAATLVLLALLAGMAGTTWGLIRAARANAELTQSRAAVQARYDLAVDAIKTFHTGVSEDFLLKEDKFKALRGRLLTSASEFYEKLGALLKDAADLPSRRALLEANFEVANLAAKVGRTENALALHQRVLAGREALAALPRVDPGTAVDVSRSQLAVGRVLDDMGRTEEAQAAYVRARSAVEVNAGPPEGEAARSAFADAVRSEGWLLYRTGRADEALRTLERARDLQESLAEADPANNDKRGALARSHHTLGRLLIETGKPVEAEAEFRKALAIQEKLVDANPSVTLFQSNFASSHLGLGYLLSMTGKPGEAEAEYRKALAIQLRLAEDNPAVTEFREGMAHTQTDLGNQLSELGKPGEAEAEYRKALDLYQKLTDDNPKVTGFRKGLADIHNNLSNMLYETGKLVEAEAECRKALDVYQKLTEDNPKVTDYQRLVVTCHNNVSNILRDNHRPAEALQGYDRALAIGEPLARANPRNIWYQSGPAFSLRARGRARLDLADLAGAAADMRRSLAIWENLPRRNALHWFETACCSATLSGLAGRKDSGVPAGDAPAHAEQAMAMLRKAIGMGFRDTHTYRTETALDPLRGREDFKKLLAELEKAAPAKQP